MTEYKSNLYAFMLVEALLASIVQLSNKQDYKTVLLLIFYTSTNV